MNDKRAAEVLRRVRRVPEGRVTTYGDLSRGDVPRDDVAAVLLAVLEEPGSIGKTFELVSGDTPIEEAVRAL